MYFLVKDDRKAKFNNSLAWNKYPTFCMLPCFDPPWLISFMRAFVVYLKILTNVTIIFWRISPFPYKVGLIFYRPYNRLYSFIYLFIYSFICLFVYLFIYLFISFESSQDTPRKISKSFVKIGIDLADILFSIFKIFYLFLYLFLFESSCNTHSKIPWNFHKDLACFGWDIVNLKCVFISFVCLFLYFVWIILWYLNVL